MSNQTSVKQESVARYVLRLTVTLLLITSFVAVALAAVNMVTAPIIAAENERKTQEAVNQVLEGGGERIVFAGADASGLVSEVYASETGYAIKVAPNGFGGAIEMMVGVSKDGKVLGISIIKHAETPSLGAVAADKGSNGQSFRDSFIGLSGEVKVSKEGGQADTISGATITSKAVAEGVNIALECAKKLG